MIDSLPDHLVFLILSHVTTIDQWLLQFVCKRFKFLIPKLDYDPKRERILDIVLAKALKDGALASIRFLWSSNNLKRSNIWNNAITIAIEYNHDEIIQFLLDNKCEYNQEIAFKEALKSNNLLLAKKLYKLDILYTQSIQFVIIKSNSIEILDWILSKKDNLLKEYDFPISLIQYAINSKVSIDFIKKLLSYMRRLDDNEINCLMSYCIGRNCSHIIEILRNVPDKNEKLILCAIQEGNRDILEKAYSEHLNIMLRMQIYLTNDFHGFLRSKGHAFVLDMFNCIYEAMIYINSDKIDILMKLKPDITEWLDYLPYNLSNYKIKIDIIKLISKFLDNRKINFEIKYFQNKEIFDILCDIGGYCTEITFRNAVVYDGNDNNKLYIEIWNRLNEKAKDNIKNNSGVKILYTGDIYLLEFLESQGILINNICIYWNAKYFTKDLVQFCLKQDILHTKLLDHAIAYGAYDIIEILAPLCTYKELVNMNHSVNQNIKKFQKDIIREKTYWIFKPLVNFI